MKNYNKIILKFHHRCTNKHNQFEAKMAQLCEKEINIRKQAKAKIPCQKIKMHVFFLQIHPPSAPFTSPARPPKHGGESISIYI